MPPKPSRTKILKKTGNIIANPQKRNIINTQKIVYNHFSNYGHPEMPVPAMISALLLGYKIIKSAYNTAKDRVI